MARTVRAEYRETIASVGGDLEVNARPSGAQRTHEFIDQTIPLDLSNSADHGQPGVQVERECVLAGFDDETFEMHARTSARGVPQLEDGVGRQTQLCRNGRLVGPDAAASVRSRLPGRAPRLPP